MPDPITIGILHSLEGPMAINERPLVDAALLAVEELNESGGLLGRRIKAVVGDGKSESDVFAAEAERLITGQSAKALFGCWTSCSRKAVKGVVEGLGSMLWYPVQYEGLEQSKHIVYTGSCLNQQVEPVMQWALANGKRRIALIGSDYVYPRTANKLLRSLLADSGASVVHESYHAMNCFDFSGALATMAAQEPDLILNTINGQSNIPFFAQLSRFPSLTTPGLVCSLSCTETIFSTLGPLAKGHLACWSYFQTLDTPQNKAFLARLRGAYGGDRVSSDPMATAYSQIMLWARAVRRTGSFGPVELRGNLAGTRVDCPLGDLEIRANNHVLRRVRMGRCGETGQLEIIWCGTKPIEPLPWLGVENSGMSSRNLLLDVLRTLPEDITIRAQLESEVERRKAAEMELVKKQRQLLETEQIAMVGGFERQVTTGEGYWSENLFRLLGYAPHEITPSLDIFLDHMYPEEREAFRKQFEEAIREAKNFKTQCRVCTKDGSTRHLQVQYAMVADEAGRTDHYHGTVMDITERKQAEEALRASEEKMRAMAEAAPDALVMADAQGRILFWSRSAESMFGWSCEEALGHEVHSLLAPEETRVQVVKGLSHFARTGQGPVIGRVTEAQAVRRDKKRFPVELSVAGFMLGEARFSLANIRDISSRKQAEQDLMDFSDRLALASKAGNIGIWEWDIGRDFVIWDRQMFLLYGVAPAHAPHTLQDWCERVHPDDVQAVRESVRLAAEGDQPWETEFRITWPNGEVRYIKCAAQIRQSAMQPGKRMIGVNWDVTEARRSHEQMRLLATTDPLTGIFNRRRFLELAQMEVDRCCRYSVSFALLMLDADKFKNVNDTYGHDVGDMVLKAITVAAAEELRDVDILGRLGGEEFAVGLPHTELAGALHVAERLRQAIEKSRVTLKDGRDVTFTVSVGVTAFTHSCGKAEDLLRFADQALYQAKESGRNRVEACVPETELQDS